MNSDVFSGLTSEAIVAGLVIAGLWYIVQKIVEGTAPDGAGELLTRVMRGVVWTVSISIGLIIVGGIVWLFWPSPGPRPPVVVAFKADAPSIEPGSSTWLRWEVTNASDLIIDPIGKVGLSGSVEVTPKASTIYSLKAAGPGGKAPLKNVTIEVTPPRAPDITFRADPDSIEPGSAGWLRWKVTNASEVVIEGVGKVAAVGSLEVRPATSTTYGLTAEGPGGRLSAQATVIVAAAPHVTPPSDGGNRGTSRVQEYWNPVSVRMAHYHSGGDSPIGTFEISPDGISWVLPSHPGDEFKDRPCPIITSAPYNDAKLEMRVDTGKNNNKKYTFTADSQTLQSVRTGLYARCRSGRLEERGSTQAYVGYSGGRPISFFGDDVKLLSEDKGDAILFQLKVSAPWIARLVVDVNHNSVIDSGDIEYGNDGLNTCDMYARGTQHVCNEFHSAGPQPIVEGNASPAYASASLVTSVTRVIPKRELSTREPFVMVLIWAFNLQTKNQNSSDFIKIPFAMSSNSTSGGLVSEK